MVRVSMLYLSSFTLTVTDLGYNSLCHVYTQNGFGATYAKEETFQAKGNPKRPLMEQKPCTGTPGTLLLSTFWWRSLGQGP